MQPSNPTQQLPQSQPPIPPLKKKSYKRLWLILSASLLVLTGIVVLSCVSSGQSQEQQATQNIDNNNATMTASSKAIATTQTQQAQIDATTTAIASTTTQSTEIPTVATTPDPTQAPTQKTAAIPTASDLNQLLSPVDGTVTNVGTTNNNDGIKNVAIDITVNNPTQSKIKHMSYVILTDIFQLQSVGVVNLSFHANGYTGMDDPIASSGGVASQANWISLDENQSWNAADGIFEVNLPA